MSEVNIIDFGNLYAHFQSPISALNCGDKCAPYNERGVPFCCDLHHAVPTAYKEEWDYLQKETDLWKEWEGDNSAETQALKAETPEGQVLIACQGFELCQRGFRSITCRAFPFFPYLTREGDFIGLSYYWEYEDRCWVISNLQVISPVYRAEFIAAYDRIFDAMPQERANFRHHSMIMRRIFGRRGRAIPLLHRNGFAYKITPRNGRLRKVGVDRLPKFGPYKVAANLPFPDEINF